MFFEDRLEESAERQDVADEENSQDNIQSGPSSQLVTPGRPSTAAGPSHSFVQALVEATENERCSPCILPYPAEIVDQVVTQMAHQKTRIAALAEEERQQIEDLGRSLLPFRPSDIMALEIQRYQFFLVELLRTRLRKIEKLCTCIYFEGQLETGAHSPEEFAAVTVPQRAYLSPNEKAVADHLAVTLHRAVSRSGLQMVPENLQHLIPHLPDAEGAEILPRVVESTYVFGIALEDLGVVQLAEGVEQAISEGEIFLMSFRTFKPFVLSGRVRLL